MSPIINPAISPIVPCPATTPTIAPAISPAISQIPPPIDRIARLLVAAMCGVCAALSTPAAGQGIDPSAPLPPLPDLGVAWPAADAPGAPPAATTPPDEALVRYRVELTGVEGAATEAEFRQLSTLRSGGDRANLAQIEARARADVALTERLLRAHGHYAGTASYQITPPAAAGGDARVVIAAVPGALYAFETIDIATSADAPRALLERELALPPGAAVDAAAVLAAEERVRLALPRNGYPFATVAAPEIVVDHDRRVARYRIAIDPGPSTRFGVAQSIGSPDLGAKHLGVIARFKPGDQYDQALVDDFRRALIATSLFSSVAVVPVRVGADRADLAVTVAPAPLRTVAGEIGYDTIDGFRIEALWRHRNLLPPEGAVTARAVFGTREQSVGAELVRSNWRRRDQLLSARFDIARLDTQAYRSDTVSAAARLERRTTLIWQKPWTYSVGAELVASRERDLGGFTGRTDNFFLVALPATLAYDGSDDLLDPSRGFRISGRLSPEASLEANFLYARARIDGSAYLPLGGRTVVAGRIALGAIAGASRVSVPPSRRWYVGGGGSVRGYGFQDVGPKDADGDPVGGRSFTELAAEIRFRITDTIGIVPFFDAGALYTTSYPELGGFQYGAGIGARYYSSFGPIRLDVATPINGRRGDPDVAIYVSIGQAF